MEARGNRCFFKEEYGYIGEISTNTRTIRKKFFLNTQQS